VFCDAVSSSLVYEDLYSDLIACYLKLAVVELQLG